MSRFGIPEKDAVALPKGSKPIQLYSLATPNGIKIASVLEELGGAELYDAHKIDIMKGDQFNPEFLKVSPNNKIPCIVDSENGRSVMESAAIAIYLCEKYADRGGKRLLGEEDNVKYEVLEWTMWQMGSFGPMLGQYGHFTKYAPAKVNNDLSKIEYGRERYRDEAKRLFGVLNLQLETIAARYPGKDAYVCGPNFTIADAMIHPWIFCVEKYYGGFSETSANPLGPLSTWPAVEKYYNLVLNRPQMQLALKVTPF